MKALCTQENLEKGINIVSKLAGGRASLPILNNILIEAKQGKITFSVTDLEVGIKTSIGGKIKKEGKITIPARIFLDFVSGNKDKNINVNLNNKKLTLKSKRFSAHINGIDASEFPLIPKITNNKEITISSKDLEKALHGVVVAASYDESRPTLSGVHFNLKNNLLYLAATDSYRLAEKKINLKNNTQIRSSFTIPLKTAQEIIRIISFLDDYKTKTFVLISENQVSFKVASTEITSRLVEGEFPNYKQIIPKGYETKFIADRDELLNIVKVVGFFAKETANNIKIKIKEDGGVSVSTHSSQVGDSEAQLEARVKGPNSEISFNAKFVTDVLTVLNSEEVIFKMKGKFNPGLFCTETDKNYLYVIMPLKTEEEEGD